MAAITSYTEIKELKVPGMRCFSMTASDGDTFSPTEITPVKAFAKYDADPATGNEWGCTVSSGTITLNCTSASSVAILLFVIGKD